MSKKNLENVGIKILVGCAVLLAVLILVQKFGMPSFLQKSPSPQTPAPANAIAPRSTVDRSKMSESEQILTPPAPNASPEEGKAYFNFVQGRAQAADALTVGEKCITSPLVMKLQLKKSFVIKNTDTADHVISFNKEHIYTIPAGKAKNVVADFGHDAGIYGYGCDSTPGAAGMVLVAQ